MTLAETSANLIEDLLKQTKKIQKRIMDLEISLYACLIKLDAQKVDTSQYRLAFKQLPCGIYLKDVDMKYLFCNEAYARIINKRPEDIQGKTNRELFQEESADHYSEGEQRYGSRGRQWRQRSAILSTVWKERFLPREGSPGMKSVTAPNFLAF